MNLLEVVFSICCVFLGVSIVYLIITSLSFMKDSKKECSFDEYLEKLDKDFYYDFYDDKYSASGDYSYKDVYYDSVDIMDTEYRVV